MNSIDTIHLIQPQQQAEWDQYYHLRWELLRKAWQQPPGSERDKHESNAFHIMATNSAGIMLGVGRIHKSNSYFAQIRFMAVKKEYRRTGIGHKILAALETQASVWKVESITLNARNSQLAFYLKHHYEVIEPAETLFDLIKHTRMRKII